MLIGAAAVAGILKLRQMHINNLVSQRTSELEREIAVRREVEEALKQARDDAVRARDELHFHASHDALTGILNRRAILELLGQETERAKRTGNTIGLMLVDVDFFKTINDTFGHCTGDTVLQEITQRISRTVRPYDSTGRYGGEEFLVVLPDCDRSEVLQSAERIRLAIAETPIVASATEIKVTISVGAAGFSPASLSIMEILTEIDAALYHAKREGRDRTVLSECARPLWQVV